MKTAEADRHNNIYIEPAARMPLQRIESDSNRVHMSSPEP